jgi:hypothetical protein
MSALHGLLDERQRYQGWLSTLEGRRSSTPPHVYERVQRDYMGRLDRVMQALAERAGQLTGTIDELATELATIRQSEVEQTDERSEAELRAAVGELTPDDWEQRRAEIDRDLERLAAERHSVEAELEELRRIVALTRSIKPENTAPDAGVAGSRVADDGAAATAGTYGNERAGSPSAAPAEAGPSIDDFVAEWSPPQVRDAQLRDSQARGAQSGAASGGQGAGQDAGNSDIAEHGDGVIPAAPMGGNPVGAAGADYGIANGVTGVAGLAPSAPIRTPPPVAAGDTRRDSDKTLKCPECGAMNYATEWYCERCGGELSTF